MNQIIENAVQAEARRCSDAIKSAMKARPRPKFDSVSKPLLSQHYEKVKPLGVSFIADLMASLQRLASACTAFSMIWFM
ncbi:hypothetical protein ACUOA8_53075, partial [Escherichia sp. SS-MK2]